VPLPRVLGHRDTNSTACPGSALYSQLDDLRARVATGEALPGVATFLAAALSRSRLPYGQSATVGGALTSNELAPIPAQPVRVQVLRSGRWRTLAELVTGADGTWTTTVKPKGTRILRATYSGDGFWRRSFSAEQLLRVKPLVQLDPAAGVAVRGRRVGVRGHVTPRKRRVYQVLQQRIRGVYQRVGVRSVPVRSGVFRSSFTPSFAGLYRVYVLAAADASTDRGRSPLRVVRVARP
jgi:hypothetical protein